MRLSTCTLTAAALLALGCGEQPVTESLELPVTFARAPATSFQAHQTGAEEVPAVTTRGHGLAVFHLSQDGTELRYKLVVNNVANVTQSHIHIAPAGANGPVVVFLYGLNPAGISKNGVLAEGVITQANLIPRPAIGFGGTMAELLTAMRNGGAYVNVHTLAFPAGETRGQLHGPGDR